MGKRVRKKHECPLCGSPLSEEIWLRVTGHWSEKQKLIAETNERIKAARLDERTKQIQKTQYVQNLLKKRDDKLDDLRKQNRDLRQQLQRGTTPQMEGLLFEEELCRQLGKRFPDDRVIPCGKGGDIVVEIKVGGQKIGILVFECKRTQRLHKKYIEQARRACLTRSADYSILVTAAGKTNTFGFWTNKDVLIVHPAGVLALTSWLRDSLVKLAEARMTRRERERAVREIMGFIQSPSFRTPLRDIVRRSEQLGCDLIAEAKMHKQLWLDRLGHYQAIWGDGLSLGHGVDGILKSHSIKGKGKSPKASRIVEAYPVAKQQLFLPATK
jgi:hypothetical protein